MQPIEPDWIFDQDGSEPLRSEPSWRVSPIVPEELEVPPLYIARYFACDPFQDI